MCAVRFPDISCLLAIWAVWFPYCLPHYEWAPLQHFSLLFGRPAVAGSVSIIKPQRDISWSTKSVNKSWRWFYDELVSVNNGCSEPRWSAEGCCGFLTLAEKMIALMMSCTALTHCFLWSKSILYQLHIEETWRNLVIVGFRSNLRCLCAEHGHRDPVI